MNKEQVVKLLRVALIATLLMFLFEVLFAIPGVTEGISTWVNSISQKWLLWVVIWLIMFVQVCFIPIPAYIVLNAALLAKIIDPSHGLWAMLGTANCWVFIAVVLSAYMAGAMIAYLMGRKWGKKAIKWCAGSEEDYDKWTEVLNKKGKWWYAATIVLPAFPDDLLCLVAGSVRLKPWFFFWSNLIGRGIGLIVMVGALAVMQSANSGGIPWTMIGWGVALLAMIVVERVLTHQLKKKKQAQAVIEEPAVEVEVEKDQDKEEK